MNKTINMGPWGFNRTHNSIHIFGDARLPFSLDLGSEKEGSYYLMMTVLKNISMLTHVYISTYLWLTDSWTFLAASFEVERVGLWK